ncbi:hypothetical protein OsI_01246 [Oryza sativa Indica Group]|uniref:Uncharacterized protein n=1 Tax=Oryza sativa subsp. indica TaxID=39946 RepID=A2WN22_ORYSI|nr:hypothetical protein OsI_01246 [Oryza sativa Indica Group]
MPRRGVAAGACTPPQFPATAPTPQHAVEPPQLRLTDGTVEHHEPPVHAGKAARVVLVRVRVPLVQESPRCRGHRVVARPSHGVEVVRVEEAVKLGDDGLDGQQRPVLGAEAVDDVTEVDTKADGATAATTLATFLTTPTSSTSPTVRRSRMGSEDTKDMLKNVDWKTVGGSRTVPLSGKWANDLIATSEEFSLLVFSC